MTNLEAILEAGGGSFQNVVKTTVLLADMGDFGAVNEIYGVNLLVPCDSSQSMWVRSCVLASCFVARDGRCLSTKEIGCSQGFRGHGATSQSVFCCQDASKERAG